MKIKSLISTAVLVGAMALMAVGVQAATYSASGTAESGSAKVDVKATTDASETDAKVSGYIMELTYDPTKVTPVKQTNPDLTGGDLYAVEGANFDADNTVLVSDIKATSATSETLVVAWASASPVALATGENVLASVNFTVKDGVTEDVPIGIQLTTVTNDGTSIDSATVADGTVEVAGGTVYLYGDADLDGYITASDVNLTIQWAANGVGYTELQKKIVDVDADDAIAASDVNLIIQKAANGDLVHFPVGDTFTY